MALDGKVKQILDKALSRVDDQTARSPRLLDDARRLCSRVNRFLEMKLLPVEALDTGPLELACHALQLPLRNPKAAPIGKLGRTNLRERAEQAAEMLVGILGDQGDEAILDRAIQLLHELPQRSPMLDEARILADAVNLDDFGVNGLLLQAIHLCRTGGGVAQVLDGLEKRELDGYWDARLKEGFHFEAVRQIARERLDHSRRDTSLMLQDIKEERLL